MNAYVKFSTFFFILFSFQTTFSQTKIDAKLTTEINSHFEAQNKQNVPGAAIVIVEKGQVIFQNNYGNANLEYEIPVNENTKFSTADICNQFVAYAMLILENEGKLSLEDDIRKHLPELPEYEKTVKIKHLLMHQHGLVDFMNLQFIRGAVNKKQSPKEALILMTQLKHLVHLPGEDYNYNSTGFLLAAEIIERISGKSFPKYAEENIFKPLKMSNSHFYADDRLLLPNKTNTYYLSENVFKNDRLYYHSLPSSNLFASIGDLGKWMMHLQENNAVCNKFNTESVYLESEGYSLGLGQFVDDLGGVKRLHQNGLAYGNLTYIARFPEHNFGIAVLSNNSGFNAREAALAVAEIFLKKHYTHGNQEEAAAPTPKESQVLSTEILKFYCGHYWNSDHFYARQIYLKNDTLIYSRGNGRESKLFPINENTFEMVGGTGVSIEFKNESGKKIMLFNYSGYQYHYEAYEPIKYTETELNTYEGTYFSKQIGTAYSISIKDKKLIVSNIEVDEIPFEPIRENIFVSSQWWFSGMEFEKNDTKEVKGFWLSTADVKGIWFEKI